VNFNTTPPLPVQKSELDQVMAHLFKSAEFLQMALPKLRDSDFDAQLERPHKLLWTIIERYHKTYGSLLPAEHIIPEVEKCIFNSVEFASRSVQDAIYHLAKYMVSYPVSSLNLSSTARILERFMFQRRVYSGFVMLAEAGLVSPENVKILGQESQETLVVQSTTSNPFECDMLGLRPKIRTGVSFVDELLNGGARAGEAYGFLAPTGGGKTTLANQIGISFARQKKHFVVFSYEQPTDNEYMVPVYACATGINRDRISAITTMQDLSEAEQRKFAEARKDLAAYLHYKDMSGTHSLAGSGGLEEIEAALVQFRDAKTPVSAFVIDWFWPMMQRRYTQEPTSRNQPNERIYAIKLVDELRQVCGRHNCWCWVNHQSAPATVSKSRKATWTDAAEVKGWSWYLTGCFALNDINEETCQATINFSKARNTKKAHRVIKLLGDIATFVDVSTAVSYNRRTSTYENKAKPGEVPDAGQVRL